MTEETNPQLTKEQEEEDDELHEAEIMAGHTFVTLKNKEGKKIRRCVHRLVARTFIPNPKGYKYIKHIDGNVKKNHASNLKWVPEPSNPRLIAVLKQLDFCCDDVCKEWGSKPSTSS